jgi:dolichyl-phosphate-mannose-protein mannosyltransferase
VALAVRLINLLLLSGDNNLYFSQNDSATYWSLGAGLAHSQTFVPSLLSITDRMPLYLLLLGGVQSLFGNAPGVVAWLQAIIDSGTCVLIAALGGLFSRAVGTFAGMLAALSINLVIYSTQILTETAFLFFFTGFLYAGARFLRTPDSRLALIAGVGGGLSLEVRPVAAILLVAAIPVVFFGALFLGRRMTAAFTGVALFLAGVVLPVAPVLLRNATHYGTWKLMSETGEHLAFWVVPLVTQRANAVPYQQTMERMRAIYTDRLAELGLNDQADPFQLDAVKIDLARKAMAELPLSAFVNAWLEGMVVNIASPAIILDPRVRALPKPSFYDTSGPTLWSRAQTYVFEKPGLYQGILLLGLLATLPLLVLQAAGFVLLARHNRWAAVFAGGVLAYFLMINGPVATPKYRLPMEPVLIVLTAIALERMVRALGDERRQDALSLR